MARPNFFVVGAARCGTTSFVHYLQQHPDIFVAPHKEPHYFASEEMPRHFGEPMRTGQARLEDRIVREEHQYVQLFEGVRGESMVGEASVYYLFYPHTAYRIAREVPNAKIIMLLRNPIDRAYSAYGLLTRDGRETLSFEESLALESDRRRMNYEPIWFYTELGQYASQVERYQAAFGRDRVHVILTEDLEESAPAVLESTFAFLGVRPDFQVNASARINRGGIPRSVRARRLQDVFLSWSGGLRAVREWIPPELRAQMAMRSYPPLSTKTRQALWAEFASDVGRLAHLLDRDLSQWTQIEGDR